MPTNTKALQVAEPAGFVAGKNKIINGDFGVWQRGTSFSNPASNAYIADRFAIYYDGTGATRTLSQQTFTAGTAPVTGYEGTYFFRYAQTVAGTSNTANIFYQRIEDVRTFANQSAVLSFWAKADTTRTVTASARQYFGSGGSADVNTSFTGSASVTTSWTRFSFTISIPSISGKTLGTGNCLEIQLAFPAGTTPTIDIWGVQFEAGSVATPFTTATGTIQGELAACQRYYFRNSNSAKSYAAMGTLGYVNTTSNFELFYPLPVTMRTAPTSVDFSNLRVYDYNTSFSVSAATLSECTPTVQQVAFTISGATTGRNGILQANNNTSAYLGFSAEL